MTHVIVFGTEEPQDMQLYNRGVALDGTGLTVALDFIETVIGVSVAWLDQVAGKVRVTGCENLALGRYHMRYKLTDGFGTDGFAPNDKDRDVWLVVR